MDLLYRLNNIVAPKRWRKQQPPWPCLRPQKGCPSVPIAASIKFAVSHAVLLPRERESPPGGSRRALPMSVVTTLLRRPSPGVKCEMTWFTRLKLGIEAARLG